MISLKSLTEELSQAPKRYQILFLETLVADMTVLNRALWSEEAETVETRLDALKWSNELAHRLFGLLFELRHGEATEHISRMAENINFYRKQSNMFSGHLSATLKSAYNRYHLLCERLFPNRDLEG